MVCIRCQKRPAIIFIQRMDNGQMKQEGYCLHCARELHIKPVEDLMKQYTSLTHAFETGGGYLYRSELVGVLKGLGFTEDEFSKPVATLSGGQKQRVAIATALVSERKILVLDEPTSGLDLQHMKEVADELVTIQKIGKTSLVITHDYELIVSCCTHVLHLEHGMVQEQYALDAAGLQRLQKFFIDSR